MRSNVEKMIADAAESSSVNNVRDVCDGLLSSIMDITGEDVRLIRMMLGHLCISPYPDELVERVFEYMDPDNIPNLRIIAHEYLATEYQLLQCAKIMIEKLLAAEVEYETAISATKNTVSYGGIYFNFNFIEAITLEVVPLEQRAPPLVIFD